MNLTGDPETAPAPDPGADEFRAKLLALTPRPWVTWVLVAANVAVWVFMVIRGTSIATPSSEDLIAFGADYGPLTTRGEWWRLLTSTFIHIGFVHLLMNMWVLWSAGPLVERMFGSVSFAAGYLIAGLAGSITSTAVQPLAVSAGASGAIFGVYGLLGAFLLRQPGAMPTSVLSELKKSSFAFLAFNIIYGVTKSGVDLAAHGGGLVGGFLAGLWLVRDLDAAARANSIRRSAIAVLLTVVAIAGVALALPRTFQLGFEIHEFSAEMESGLKRSQHLKTGGLSYDSYATFLEGELLVSIGRRIERMYKHRDTLPDEQGPVADTVIAHAERLRPIIARMAKAFRAHDDVEISKEANLVTQVFENLQAALSIPKP